MAFSKEQHLIKVQGGRLYLPVAARVLWFREAHPDWGIETSIVTHDHDKQFAVCRCVIRDAAGRVMATATKMENAKGFGDFLEKAETGSIGRALGMCGFGTDSDPDMDDGKRAEAGRTDSPRPAVTPSQDRGRGGYGPSQRAGGRA